ncbi:hypothetical protein [Paraburkholderia sp. A3BS-1L]|uniref:hypothetical protein n=1 Tax=Paraburkholderia sp. A3BS-1L TaxID=3028375 RepID=UPI003DA8F80F
MHAVDASSLINWRHSMTCQQIANTTRERRCDACLRIETQRRANHEEPAFLDTNGVRREQRNGAESLNE